MQITEGSLVFGAMESLKYLPVLRKTIIENTTSSIRGNIIMTVALFRCCILFSCSSMKRYGYKVIHWFQYA